jgi:uncharacterized membrane protein
MGIRFSKIASLALMGLLSIATLSLAATTPADAATITLRTCNHTRHTVMVASSYIPVGGSDWRNVGWTRVNARSCTNIFRTKNRTFYARAEIRGNSSRYWGTDIKQCVEYPGPYDFYTRSEDTTCPEGEPQKFTTFHSDGRPIFVWNLDP